MWRLTAPETGTFECRIHDIEFGGLQDYVYRLTIRSGPYVRSVYPLGGKRDSEVRLALSGYGLSRQSLTTRIADVTTGFAVWKSDRSLNPITLAVGGSDEVQEVAATPSQPVVASLPVVCNGQIESAGDVDLWPFEASKDQRLVFDVAAERLESRLDSELTVIDENGKELASNKDAGNGSADARLIWKAPEDGQYVVRIRDELASRGGEDFAYRLSIEEVSSDGFTLSLPGDSVTVDRGGETKLKVSVDRSLGWKEAIELTGRWSA